MAVDSRRAFGAAGNLRCDGCHAPGPFRQTLDILLQCLSCELVFADPGLTIEQVHRLYGTRYFNGDEYTDYLGDKVPIQRSFQEKIAFMRRCAPGIQSVYEIGAAYGYFLDVARKHWEAAGIDISVDAAAFAREYLGLDVEHGEFLCASIKPGRYDAFCMWDTIEHLVQPRAYVKRAAELVAPGGYLFISTGDIDAWLPRRQGRSWRLIHPPTHLFYFSRTTLLRLLESNGWRVRAITTMGMHRSLRQTVYSAVVQHHPRRLEWYQRFARTAIARKSFYVNLGDIMVVAAQAA